MTPGARVAAAGEGGPPALPRPAKFLADLAAESRVVVWDVSGPAPDLARARGLDRCWTDALWERVGPLFSAACGRRAAG